MIRLVTTELTRLRWRRAVLVLVAAAVVLPVLIGLGVAWSTRPYSEDEIASARQQARSQPGFEQEVKTCEERPRRMGVASADRCEAEVLSWYSGIYRDPLDLAQQRTESAVGVAAVVLGLMVLAGTTFAGADWASGSMSNQLLFEPRRLRVWLAKAIAVGLLATLLAAVVMTLYWAGLHLVAASRDIDAPDGFTGEVAWMVARTSVLTGLGAVAGYAVTMLVRSTVFTLGALFAVSTLSTFLIAAIPFGADKERWMPPVNVLAVIMGRVTYYREPPLECATGDPTTWDASMQEMCNSQVVVSVWDGLVYLLVPLVLVVALSLWSFRRRDVP